MRLAAGETIFLKRSLSLVFFPFVNTNPNKNNKRRREKGGKENKEQSYHARYKSYEYLQHCILKRRTRSLSSHRPIHKLIINSK